MPRILIAYATTHGQTGKIASCIRDHLEQLDFDVTMVNVKERVAPSLDDFDGVIVGASIIARGHQPAVAEFIRERMYALNAMPSAFFSVSASAGSALEKGRAAARRVRNAFLAETGFAPVVSASIAGAIKYTRYNFVLRWYMKRASKMNGGSTDATRDHEYTDWHQVEDFARQFAAEVQRSIAREPGPDALPYESPTRETNGSDHEEGAVAI